MTYEIQTENNTQTFNDDERNEFEDMKSLLDEQGVEYTAGSSEDTDGQATTPEPSEPAQDGAQDVTSEKAYLTDHMGVPDVFLTQLKGGSWHVDKTGYYHLADQQGISVKVKPLDPSYENDNDRSTWLGIAIDTNEREYSNVGSAHLAGENMSGAEYNLDELAATRAACRVLSMATGVGSTATEEMPNE